jgi:predicted short-subunit dehydrogenase-like oxidoreductase (DUF2520 family)
MSCFVVIGPGRIGTALARLWIRAGHRLLGCHARGGALAPADFAAAAFVVIAVDDDQVAAVAARAAPAARRGALWFHTSGSHGLEVLAPLRARGCLVGSLHPLCAVHDAAQGVRDLPGRVAALQGSPAARRRLARLALEARMRPVTVTGRDRALYHAACALASNGLCVLYELAARVFTRAGAPGLHADLVASTLAACRRHGGRRALTGPAVRGDVHTIRAHLRALRRKAGPALPVYRALMQQAAQWGGKGAARALLGGLSENADG